MVSFDTNILVYATLSDPLATTHRARDLLVRGMRTGSSILLLQTLAEFSSVAIRKAGIGVDAVRTTIAPGERCCLSKLGRMTIFRWHSMR
jgi:predicted nucleic acid-binding protein